MTIAQMIVALGVDNSGFTRGIREGVGELKNFSRQVDATSLHSQSLARSSGAIASGLKGLIGGLAAGLGAAGIGVALKGAASSASQFGLAMAEVSTLLSNTDAIPQLEEAVKALAIEFGKVPAEEVGALYQIISAGATNAAQATAILTAANKVSVAGLTDVKTAADGLTTILNAYGPSAGTAADVSDALFVAMRSGKTTIRELSESIGTVAPLAAQAGASLEETLAAASALTKGGISTNVAMTGLRATLAAIVKPSTEAQKLAKKLGIEFSAAGLASKGLGGFLQDLQTKTGGNVELIAELVGGVEALAPVLSLTGTQAASFAAILESMGQKSGEASAALAKITGTPAQQFKQLQAQVAVLAIDIGQKILKIALPALQALNRNFTELVAILAAVGKSIAVVAAGFVAFRAVALAATLTGTVAAFVTLIPAITGAADALTLAGFAARGFLAALGPIGIAALAIGALATLFYKQGQAAREAQRATDDYSRSLIGLSKTQLGAMTADLQSQLAALQAQRTVVEQMAGVAVSDATGTRRAASRSTARETQEAKRLTAQIGVLQKQLDDTKAAFDGAFDGSAMQAEIDKITAGLTGTGDATAKAKSEFELLTEAVTATLDTLDALRERSQTVEGWAKRLPAAFEDAATALRDVERKIAEQDFVGAVDTSLLALANTIRIRIREASEGAFRPLIDAAQEAITRSRALAEGNFSKFAQGQALATLQAQYAAVTQEITLQGGPLRANVDLLTQANALAKEITERKPAILIDVKKLEAAVDLLGPTIDKAMRELERHLDGLTVDFGEMATAVADLAAGILTVSDALGGLDSETERALSGVLQLAEGLERVAKGDIISGLAGTIAGGINLISGIAGLGGPDPAIVAALEENSKRLQEVAAGLARFPTTGSDIAAALRASAFVTAQNAGVAPTTLLTGLEPILSSFGISLARLDEIARKNGIQLLDESGRAIAGSFAQLVALLDSLTPSLTQFADTIDGARRRQELLDRVSGTAIDPTQALQREVDLLEQFLAPANGFMIGQLESLFAGLDASTAEGRAEVQSGLRELAQIIASGGLSLEQLGQFETVDDLVAAILSTQDALDALSGAANEAVQGMLNIPTGFRIAAARFAAQTPMSVTAPTFDPGAIGTGDITFPSGVGGPQSTTVTVAAGAIVIQGAGKNADDVATEVLRKFRERARAQTGDTLDWGGLK